MAELAEGRCLCGAITFEAVGAPLWVAHCHCESCRRQTGSVPATFVGYAQDKVTYRTPPVEYQSSEHAFRAFCPTCGSALHYRPADEPEVHFYIGAMNDPHRFKASRHVFYNERVAGYEMLDNLPRFEDSFGQPTHWGAQPTRNVLFLCTGNSARSIMAEAITNQMSQKGVRAFSAGSDPKGEIASGTKALLSAKGIDPDAFTSKSWDLFVAADSPRIEWVITLCDGARDSGCPVLPGHPVSEHWSLPDPVSGDVSFADVFRDLTKRIAAFLQAA